MSDEWDHPFLNSNLLSSQFDASHYSGTSGDLYPPSSYTTTTATNPTFNYTVPYQNQLSYSSGSRNSSTQAYSTTGYTSTSHQRMQNPQSATAAPITLSSAVEQTQARLLQSLSQLTPESPEHTKCLSDLYKLKIRVMGALCRQIIEQHGFVDLGSEAARREWERQLDTFQEGTTQYNGHAGRYLEWYNNWYNALKALLNSDNEEEDDSIGAHVESHQSLDDVSMLTATDSRNKESRKVYRCPVQGCQTAPTRKADLDRHIEAVHKKSKSFYCEVASCSRADKPDGKGGFSRVDHLKEHYRTVHQMTERYPKKQTLKKDPGEGSSRRKGG